jgi:amidophosphoribosyltransferase
MSKPRPISSKDQTFKLKGKRLGRGAVQSGLTHECGVFGAVATGEWPTQIDIAQTICLGLVALQHRGQESAGIVTSEGNCAKHFNIHKGMGMIYNIFNEESIKKLSFLHLRIRLFFSLGFPVWGANRIE